LEPVAVLKAFRERGPTEAVSFAVFEEHASQCGYVGLAPVELVLLEAVAAWRGKIVRAKPIL